MLTYRLKPVLQHLLDRSWLASHYVGECIVRAPDAAAARRCADCTFALPVWPPDGGPVPHLPWSQPRLVDIAPETALGPLPPGQAVPLLPGCHAGVD